MFFTKFQDDDCDKLRGSHPVACMLLRSLVLGGVVVEQDVRIQFMPRHQVVKCYINIIQTLK